ncbi:MAG: DUF3536 domain-containing protein [Acidimicrobiia bacterium]
MSSSSSRPRVVIHGHFYQPPRENPWTEAVAIEPSAAPYHDWNERITAECYRPNGKARIVDDHGLVVAMVNNYEHLSFNVGPTLASWLDEHHPDVMAGMVAADKLSRSAIAQAYHHVILPLADERDVRTQVRWGLADFRYRFGRDAAGLWLPETAVNDMVMRVLAEEGVRFTILAPGQAGAVRPLSSSERPDGAWHDVSGGSVDFRKPYRWVHPGDSSLGVDIVFYNGPLSHDIAFGLGLQSAQAIIDRALADVGSEQGGTLVCMATDGETFGHHHKYSERAVAYALAVEGPRRSLPSMPLADWLETHPPTDEVRVVESAWSCAHGVGRWKEDCGCSTGGLPGWNQQWRMPLRAALDVLRTASTEVFERRGSVVFRDLWAARDDYLGVLSNQIQITEFAAHHLVDPTRVVEALTLLEAERHAMCMYTSCGWFFNDLAGIETVQILRYAGRLIDCLRELGESPPVTEFLVALGDAHSNDAVERSGRDIWMRHVLPTRVDEARVVAHLALMALLDRRDPDRRLANFDVALDGHVMDDRGSVQMCAGRVTLRHRRTWRESTHLYGAIHLGGLEVIGATRMAGDYDKDEASIERFVSAFAGGERVSALLRLLADEMGPNEFGLGSALPDATVQILESAARDLTDRFAAAFEQLIGDHQATFRALATVGFPLPAELRAPAELALARRVEADLAALEGGNGSSRLALRSAEQTLSEARLGGFNVATPGVVEAANAALLALVRAAISIGEGQTASVTALLQLARASSIPLNVDRAQELVYDALAGGATGLDELGLALGLAVGRLGIPI